MQGAHITHKVTVRGIIQEEDYPGRSRAESRTELGFGDSQKACQDLPYHRSRIKPKTKTQSNSGATLLPGPTWLLDGEKELPNSNAKGGGDGCGVPLAGPSVSAEEDSGTSARPTTAARVASPSEDRLPNAAPVAPPSSAAELERDPAAKVSKTFTAVLRRVFAALLAVGPK